MSVAEKLKNMDMLFVVQIKNPLNDEWIDYAAFKEKGAAVDFINMQVFKASTEVDLNEAIKNIYKMFRIVEDS